MIDKVLIQQACEAFDIRQDGLLDLYYISDVIYTIGLHPTEDIYNSIGRAEAENQYYINIDLAVNKIIKLIHSRDKTEIKSMHPLPSTSPLSSPEFDKKEFSYLVDQNNVPGIKGSKKNEKQFSNIKVDNNRKKLNALPPLPTNSPLSSPDFDEDAFRDEMLEETFQLSLSVPTIKPRPMRNLPTSAFNARTTRSSHQPAYLHTKPYPSKILGINWDFEQNKNKLPPFISQLPPLNWKNSRDPRIRSRLKGRGQTKERPVKIQTV